MKKKTDRYWRRRYEELEERYKKVFGKDPPGMQIQRLAEQRRQEDIRRKEEWRRKNPVKIKKKRSKTPTRCRPPIEGININKLKYQILEELMEQNNAEDRP